MDTRDTTSDDAVVAYLRARAPGLSTSGFDPRAVTSRARHALRRRRRLRHSAVAMAAVATVYLALALAGPVPVPGYGTVNVPGGAALQALVTDVLPGGPPGPAQWGTDVDRLETEVLPVVERLQLSYYLLEGRCGFLEYYRGVYRDGDSDCRDRMPFDAQARADFDEVTDAVKRSGLPVERLGRDRLGIRVQLKDHSWQYNWEYVYLPGADSPAPPTRWRGEQWTHIRDHWWFHRAHDD